MILNQRKILLAMCTALICASTGCKPRQKSSTKDLESLAKGAADAPFVQKISDLSALGGSINSAAALSENSLALTTYSNELLVFDTAQKKVLSRTAIPLKDQDAISAMIGVKGADGKYLVAIGTTEGHTFVTHEESVGFSAAKEFVQAAHQGAVSALAFVGDASFVAIGGVDGVVKVADNSGNLLGQIEQKSNDAVNDRQAVGISALAVTLDEQILIARGSEIELSSQWRESPKSQSERVLLKSENAISAIHLMEDPFKTCDQKSNISLLGINAVALVGDQAGNILGLEVPVKPTPTKNTPSNISNSAASCHVPSKSDSSTSYASNYQALKSTIKKGDRPTILAKPNSSQPILEFTKWSRQQDITKSTRIQAHHGAIRGLQLSKDGSRLISVGIDTTQQQYAIGVWDLKKQNLLRMLNYQKYGSIGPIVLRSTTAQDDAFFSSNNGDGLRRFDITASLSAFPLQKEPNIVSSAASPSGRKLISIQMDGTAKLWRFSDNDNPEANAWGGLGVAEPLIFSLSVKSRIATSALSEPTSDPSAGQTTLATFSCDEGLLITKLDAAGKAIDSDTLAGSPKCSNDNLWHIEWSRDGSFLYLFQQSINSTRVTSWHLGDTRPFADSTINASDSSFGLKSLQQNLIGLKQTFVRDHLPLRWFYGTKGKPGILLQAPWHNPESADLKNPFGVHASVDGKIEVINFTGKQPSSAEKSPSIAGLQDVILNTNAYFAVTSSNDSIVSLLRTVDSNQVTSLPYVSTQSLTGVKEVLPGPNNSITVRTAQGIELWWIAPVIE